MDLPHKVKVGAKYTRNGEASVIYTVEHVDSRVIALMSSKGIYCEVSYEEFGKNFARKIW